MARVMDILIVKGHFFRNMFPTQVHFGEVGKKKNLQRMH